jgi:hypothetical protein
LNPHWDFEVALSFGEELEDSLMAGRYEVKRDDRARQTGNLFIELENQTKTSGLLHTQADYWVHWAEGAGFGYIFEVPKLKELVVHHGTRTRCRCGCNNDAMLLSRKVLS